MRVLITGDRHWHCPELAEDVLARMLLRYRTIITIIHGGATGVDRSFAEACEQLGIDQEAHPARWEELDHPDALIHHDKHGRAYNAKAGPIRNAEMIATGIDMCVAFHRAISSSKGTKDCVKQALAKGVATYLVDSEAGVPKRITGDDERLR